ALRRRDAAEPAAGRCTVPDLCQPRAGVLTMAGLSRIVKILAGIALGIVVLVVAAFGVLQTRPAKNWLAAEAAASLSGEGMNAQIGRIVGTVPFDMRLDELRLADTAGEVLAVRNVSFSLARPELLVLVAALPRYH